MINSLKKILFIISFFLFASCKSTYENSKNNDINSGYIFKLYYKSDNAIDGAVSFWYAENEEINSEKVNSDKVKPNFEFSNLALSGIYHALLCCEDEKYKDINNQKKVDSLFSTRKETVFGIDKSQSHLFSKIDKNKTLEIYKVRIDYCTCSKEFSSFSNEDVINDKYLYVYKIEYLELSNKEKKYFSKNKKIILSKLK